MSFKIHQKIEFSEFPSEAATREKAKLRGYDVSPAELLEVVDCTRSTHWDFELAVGAVNFDLRGGAMVTGKVLVIKPAADVVLGLTSNGRPAGDFIMPGGRRSVIHGSWNTVRVSNVSAAPIQVEAYLAGV